VAITVRTQAELDRALADKQSTIYIDADEGVWITLDNRGSSHVVARGSSHVVAWDSSHVEARGSSHVVAWDSSHVEAWGSSHVVAWGSSHVEAWGSSHVEASKYVAVHLYSKRVDLSGDGHVIDVTDVDLYTVKDFLAFHGVPVVDGRATLYKAVDADLYAGQGHKPTQYPIGETVVAPDWRATNACGYGLHFGYRPAVARGYFNGSGTPRLLEVTVAVEGLVALGDKAKAESCVVVREVDLSGRPVIADQAVTS
jgi:hypothetical protein